MQKRCSAYRAAWCWCVSITGSPPCTATHRCIYSLGKSTFLNFMLAQLISAHQVVLVCKSSETHLFYHGQVYSRSTGAGLCGLPTRQQTRYCPIWALIDVDYQDRGPPIDDGSNIWPIQVSSPKPVRWKSWSKQNGAAQLGMSLWSIEELTEG